MKSFSIKTSTTLKDYLQGRPRQPDKCALPGVPPHPGGRGHLLHHDAHGDHLEGGHRGGSTIIHDIFT